MKTLEECLEFLKQLKNDNFDTFKLYISDDLGSSFYLIRQAELQRRIKEFLESHSGK
jgi:hypothetical protein